MYESNLSTQAHDVLFLPRYLGDMNECAVGLLANCTEEELDVGDPEGGLRATIQESLDAYDENCTKKKYH